MSSSSAPSPIPTSPLSLSFPPTPPPTMPLPALPIESIRKINKRPTSPPSPSPTTDKISRAPQANLPKTVTKVARMGRGLSSVTLSTEEKDLITPKKAVGIWLKNNMGNKLGK